MFPLICPVCKKPLSRREKTVVCPNGHSFDLAKQGYLNLLCSNRAVHGDDKGMVRSRTAFLEKEYYEPLRDALCALAAKHCKAPTLLLDAGGGEGWYTHGVKTALGADAICVDISKEALKVAAKRGGMTCVVASVADLPVADASIDLILNIFAPESDAEFLRVLRPGGVVLRVMPLREHLMGLKTAVYDIPRENPDPVYTPAGFTLLERKEVRSSLTLNENEEIQNLFAMTPYYYKTGRRDQEKLASLTSLTTELAFCIFAYEKD